MVQIRLEDIRKEFSTPSGTEVAVEGTDLTIEDGEFCTIVGPSGCGKTTTLRMIAGLETPTSGDIYFDDTRVTDLSPQERDIAMVFQDITLYPHMTIEENIGYGLRVRDEMEGYDEKIADIAEILGLEEMLDKKPGQLSGGQKQRVSLGRALVRDPNFVLFDEPLSDLDAELKNELRVEIQRLHEEFETTMVYVTHDQQEALTMSDRIAVMNDGDLVQVSTPEGLFDTPKNSFIGRFIGQPTMNFLEGTVTETGGVTVECEDGEILRLSAGEIPVSGESRAIRLGIRPQHMTLTEGEDNPFITATYDVDELIGTEHIAYLINGEKDLRVVVDEPPAVERGDEVQIGRPSKVYVFDDASGELLGQFDGSELEIARVA